MSIIIEKEFLKNYNADDHKKVWKLKICDLEETIIIVTEFDKKKTFIYNYDEYVRRDTSYHRSYDLYPKKNILIQIIKSRISFK